MKDGDKLSTINYQVQKEDLKSLYTMWKNPPADLMWPSPFVWPPWLKSWWDAYGGEEKIFFISFWEEERLLGVAPLVLWEGKAMLMGSEDVCDYQDFIITRGKEEEFYFALALELKRKGLEELEISSLRDNALTLKYQYAFTEVGKVEVICQKKDVLLERSLPSTWEEYLGLLKKKQRHEVRRKLRRLQEAGTVEFRWMEKQQQLEDYFEVFLDLFCQSNREKKEFLTHRREIFFRSLLQYLGEEEKQRMGVLLLDGEVSAMTWCLDDGYSIYLYNSCYNPRFEHLSAGLMCKVLALKKSIETGRICFNFLKGGEVYKYRLGGMEVPSYKVQFKFRDGEGKTR